MAASWENKLEEWLKEGLIEADAAQRIRIYEGDVEGSGGLRWPAILALAFGGVLLAAGVLLFVSAHWDDISPAARFSLVLTMVAVLHAGGAVTANRLPDLSITLHTIGTLACGGGVMLAGQIFNLAEHWPSGVLMWAAGAAIGWAVLRHWTQAAMFAILAPAWLAGEWEVASNYFRDGGETVVAAGLLALAFAYFSARMEEADSPLRQALCWVGGIFILPLAAVLPEISRRGANAAIFPWTIAVGAPLFVAWLLRKEATIYNLAAGLWVLLLAFTTHRFDDLWTMVVWATGAVGITAWGVLEARAERINLGMVAFLLTVTTYYFSNIFDMLGRSVSLIGLGIVFLAGGWGLEKLRRGLLAQIGKEAR
jgi:uncharacterized membrane protein